MPYAYTYISFETDSLSRFAHIFYILKHKTSLQSLHTLLEDKSQKFMTWFNFSVNSLLEVVCRTK